MAEVRLREAGLGCGGLTWSEVVPPLAAAVHFVHRHATQQLGLVSLLQTGHQQFAFGDLLWSHIDQLEGGLWVRQCSENRFCVLLKMKNKANFEATFTTGM